MIYVFTESHQVFQEVLQCTSAGATVQNDTMIQNSCEMMLLLYYCCIDNGSYSSESSAQPSVWRCGR